MCWSVINSATLLILLSGCPGGTLRPRIWDYKLAMGNNEQYALLSMNWNTNWWILHRTTIIFSPHYSCQISPFITVRQLVFSPKVVFSSWAVNSMQIYQSWNTTCHTLWTIGWQHSSEQLSRVSTFAAQNVVSRALVSRKFSQLARTESGPTPAGGLQQPHILLRKCHLRQILIFHFRPQSLNAMSSNCLKALQWKLNDQPLVQEARPQGARDCCPTVLLQHWSHFRKAMKLYTIFPYKVLDYILFCIKACTYPPSTAASAIIPVMTGTPSETCIISFTPE